MSEVFINANGAKLGISANRLTVTYEDGTVREIPIETVSGITLLGRSELTTPCMEQCLQRGIPVAFFHMGESILEG